MKQAKQYICLITGEIITTVQGRLNAYRYFKADGKKVGYKVHWRDVKPYNNKSRLKFGW